MDRRKFIAGSSALALANSLPAGKAHAFWVGCLMRGLLRSAGGRHMLRFGHSGSRVRFAGRSGNRARTYGDDRHETRRRKDAREALQESRNARMFKEIGELVLDNWNNGFPQALNGNITACGGCDEDEVYCGTFAPAGKSGKPVIMELCELQMLDEVGKRLPQLYPNDFASADEATQNREILSYLHPIAHIKNGDLEDEWNHRTPLEYESALGWVVMYIMETTGECTIVRKDGRKPYKVTIQWDGVKIDDGARFYKTNEFYDGLGKL